MELLNQPFNGQLGDRLIELLRSSKYETLNVFVAFAKNSGILRIKDALEAFISGGGEVNVYVGVDLGGTSYEALTSLLLLTTSLNVVHSETGQTFHPKIYHFAGDKEGLLVIGSHNLTAGGLWSNFESSIIISMDRERAVDARFLEGIGEYVGRLEALGDSFMSIEKQDDVDRLLENGYVVKEVSQQVQRRRLAKGQENRKPLFGKGLAAKLPGITQAKAASEKAKPEAAAPSSAPAFVETSSGGVDQTIWFETRAMTGGSRNILDLSRRSLLEAGDPRGTPYELEEPEFIRGGVEFFGLDPSSTGQVKNITINFHGVDYIGNTILFPNGDKSNGTWRLQIKGIAASGQRITEAFAQVAEGYLQNKIITFTKVRDDYYYLSVFADSDLDRFREASRILARNGATKSARLIGLL